MRRLRSQVVIVLCCSLVLGHEALAQRARTLRRKPFAALSESAERLKDSLSTRMREAAANPLTSHAMLLSTAGDEVRLRDSVISVARSQLGTRYRLGSSTPGKAFDCSGLIRYVMSALRLDLPRTAHEQSKFGLEIARDTAQLRPGDLLTFGTARHITHIGIYAGDGRVIHASTSRRQVVEAPITSLGPKLLRQWRSARRLIAMSDSTDQ